MRDLKCYKSFLNSGLFSMPLHILTPQRSAFCSLISSLHMTFELHVLNIVGNHLDLYQFPHLSFEDTASQDICGNLQNV